MRWCVGHTTWRERFASTLQEQVWAGNPADAIPQKWDMRTVGGRHSAGRARFRPFLALGAALLTSLFPMFYGVSADATPAADDELATLARWMTGSFDTFDQVDTDQAAGASYTHLRAVMHIAPVHIAGLSGADALTFYVEQAAAEAQAAPYRQRVYLLTRREGALVNRIFRIAEPQRFIGAHSRAGVAAQLAVAGLTLEPGCDLVWTRIDDELYTGIAGLNGTCRTTWRGAAYTVSQVLMAPSSITSLDQGFDAEGRHVWGPRPGVAGHVFRKRDAHTLPHAAGTAEEFARLRAGDGTAPVFWYVEGTVYRVGDDGSYTPARGLAGFNVARLDAPPRDGEAFLRSREIFFTTDLERTAPLPAPPLTATVELGIGVRGGRPVAGLHFAANGESLAGALAPSDIVAVESPTGRRLFTRPFVRREGGVLPAWAAESYEFILPAAASEGAAIPALTWQRDAEHPSLGRTHCMAAGHRYRTLDEVAAASPLAAEIVRLVRQRYPEFGAPPPAGVAAAPAAAPSPVPATLSPGNRQP